jgi:hypothetical protein
MPRRSYDHFNMIQHCLLTPRRHPATPRRSSDLHLPRLSRPGAGLPRPGVRLRVYSLYKPKNHILLGFRDFYIELRANTVLGFRKPLFNNNHWSWSFLTSIFMCNSLLISILCNLSWVTNFSIVRDELNLDENSMLWFDTILLNKF